MEDSTSNPAISNEVVLVAIVNKDTMQDKLKEQALVTILTGFCTLAITQGTPWLINRIIAFRTKKALEKKTKELTEKND